MFSALIGNPVDHSISPLVFKQLAKVKNMEYSHLKIQVPSEKDLPIYMDSLFKIGCVGLNVTLPYKIDIIKYLNRLDPISNKIGAVNTVKVVNGEKIGYNTDAIGSIKSILLHLREISQMDEVLILGSGGAARAIIYEVYKRTSRITILTRNLDEADKIALDFFNNERDKIKIAKLNDENLESFLKKADFLVNTTPVGMYPNYSESLISKEILEKVCTYRGGLAELYVFDAIFNPTKTRLIRDLEEMGANICSGVWMLIYQAIAAFELWSEKSIQNVDLENIASKISNQLNDNYKSILQTV